MPLRDPLPDPRWRVDTIFEEGEASGAPRDSQDAPSGGHSVADGAHKDSLERAPSGDHSGIASRSGAQKDSLDRAPSGGRSGGASRPGAPRDSAERAPSGELSGAGLARAGSSWFPTFLTGSRQSSGVHQSPAGAPEGGSGGGRAPSTEAKGFSFKPQGTGDAPRSSPLSSGAGADASRRLRSDEITTVSRIGRESSVLRVRARTLSDRNAGGGGPEMRERIRTATEAAADSLFDFTAYHNLALAGIGTVPTFHFLVAGGESHDGSSATPGPDLAGLPAVALLPS